MVMVTVLTLRVVVVVVEKRIKYYQQTRWRKRIGWGHPLLTRTTASVSVSVSVSACVESDTNSLMDLTADIGDGLSKTSECSNLVLNV